MSSDNASNRRIDAAESTDEQVTPGQSTSHWWSRANLVPGAALLLICALSWAYTLQHEAGHAMVSVGDAEMSPSVMPGAAGIVTFLAGWGVMMTAMMLPATLPLLFMYRAIAVAKGLSPPQIAAATGALVSAYLLLWLAAGVPVYGYSWLAQYAGQLDVVLPGLLLLAGGIYQFLPTKRRCQLRCSSPLMFLITRWRSGIAGAARLGAVHGVDCLGCCAGTMTGLIALGMMNSTWMFTAAVIVFVEKNLRVGQYLARPLGALMISTGAQLLGSAL